MIVSQNDLFLLAECVHTIAMYGYLSTKSLITATSAAKFDFHTSRIAVAAAAAAAATAACCAC